MANLWTYGDYVTLTDPAARLERLRLHIVEVQNHLVGNKARNGSAKFPPEYQYRKDLMAEAADLAAQVEPGGLGGISAPIAKSRGVFRRSR